MVYAIIGIRNKMCLLLSEEIFVCWVHCALLLAQNVKIYFKP